MPHDSLHPLPPTVDPSPRVEPQTVDGVTGPFESTSLGAGRSESSAEWPSIPGYAITAAIARGGMGQVFAGVELALEREVAIKVLLPGANAERFITESKITARLPHPSIPPVYALGRLPDGSPFLAMKLVQGRTLAAVLKERTTAAEGLPQLVQVFEQICQAVGFAHSRRVIHRDLKPSNVMVGAFGEVQVMDWGLAKAIADFGLPIADSPASQSAIGNLKSDMTHAGTIMGTPGYMAPEQARGEPADARADVFALGSILTTILTGEPAFTGSTVRTILDQSAAGDLSTALTRLEACGADAELIAFAKRCLSASPEARPADARAVAEQVAAYRAGVEARLRQAETERAEALIREAEQRKRRRVWLGLAAALLVGLLATSALAVWVNQARLAAQLANNLAQRRLSLVEEGNDLITTIFTDLDIRQVKQGPDPVETVLAKGLIKAAERLEGEAAEDPLTVANLQDRLGRSLMSLGHPQEAIALFLKVREVRRIHLGANHPDTLRCMNNLGAGYRIAGQYEKALPLMAETLELMKVTLGNEHSDTLNCMNSLGVTYKEADKLDQAVHLLDLTLKLRRETLGGDHVNTLQTMSNLGLAYKDADQPAKAVPLLEEAYTHMRVQLGARHPDTLLCRNNLASCYEAVGKRSLALPLYEEIHLDAISQLGLDHPTTQIHRNNLALAYGAVGKPEQALPLLEATHKSLKARLGADHPQTLTALTNLAANYGSLGRAELALPLQEEHFKLAKAKLGVDHLQTVVAMNNLAAAYYHAGKVELALPLWEEGLEHKKTKLGHTHSETLVGMLNLASAYRKIGKLDRALALSEEALQLTESKLGPNHMYTLVAMNNVATCCRETGKVEEAIAMYDETLRRKKATLGEDHPETVLGLANLALGHVAAKQNDRALPLLQEAAARLEKRKFQHEHAGTIIGDLLDCLMRLQRFDEAETWRRKWLAVVKERSGAESVAYAGELAALGLNLLQQQKWADAEPVLRESLANREKQQPEAWTTFNTQSLLGAALLGQKKYADAEPLLLKGYQGIKARAEKIPAAGRARLPEAMRRLIQLSDETSKTAEAAKYRAELAAWFSGQLEKDNSWALVWGWPRF